MHIVKNKDQQLRRVPVFGIDFQQQLVRLKSLIRYLSRYCASGVKISFRAHCHGPKPDMGWSEMVVDLYPNLERMVQRCTLARAAPDLPVLYT